MIFGDNRLWDTDLLHCFCVSIRALFHRVKCHISKINEKAITSIQFSHTFLAIIEYCIKAKKAWGRVFESKFSFLHYSSVIFKPSEGLTNTDLYGVQQFHRSIARVDFGEAVRKLFLVSQYLVELSSKCKQFATHY